MIGDTFVGQIAGMGKRPFAAALRFLAIGVLACCFAPACADQSPASSWLAMGSDDASDTGYAGDAGYVGDALVDVAADDASGSSTAPDGSDGSDEATTPCVPRPVGQGQDASAVLPLVSPVFGAHMVLERGVQVPVWGFTEACGTVSVQIDQTSQSVAADGKGRWTAYLGPFDVGPPHTLVVQDNTSSATLDDVLFGDVWLCSGQSNMEYTMAGIANSQTQLQDTNYPDLRLLGISKVASGVPLEVPQTVPWQASSMNAATNFSAVCYMTGRALQKKLGVPIGLVSASYGGTVIESWIGAATLGTLQDFVAPLAALAPAENMSDKVTVLYNAMIEPLFPMQLKGAAWYQGEFNQGRGYQYERLLPMLIDDWRKHFGQQLPFMVVQLPNNGVPETVPVDTTSGWPGVREAQLVTSQTIPQTGLVVTDDTGQIVPEPGCDPNYGPGFACLHPLDKEDVASRLTLEIESRVYGLGTPRSPTYSGMAIEGSGIRVSFNDAAQGLMVATKTTFDPVVESPGTAPGGFAICGADKNWYAASATISGSTVLVSSPSVPAPVAVRYAWAGNAVGANVYGRGGLPISPLRTDLDYMVNVIDGQGTGVYVQGAQVTVKSDPTRTLASWAGDTDVLPSPTATSNTFAMPGRYLSLQPIYQ